MSRIPKGNQGGLTKEQVIETLTFADMIYNPSSYQEAYGIYNPYILNQNLVDLNNDPLVPTYEKIKDALKSAVDNPETLQGYSEWMQFNESIYNKTLNYFANLLAFDLRYNCINAKPEDYKSKEYKEDIKRVHKFLDSFDYIREFKKMMKEMCRKNIVYTWLRDNNDEEYPQRALQMLPQGYCKITGNTSICPMFDFDMGYFLNGTTSLKLYPEIFSKYYNETFEGENWKKYKPSNTLSKRNGTFAYWHQTSISDGAYCFMFTDGNFNAIPPFAYLLKSTILNPEIELLQRDKDIASAYALLVGEIKTFDGAKSGEKKNQFTIDPKSLGVLLSKVQSGLRRNVRPVAMPTKENRYMQFVDNSPKMSSYQLETTAEQAASAGSLIFTSTKPNQQEHIDMIITDYNSIKGIYSQFNSFMNFFVNKKTRKFKFSFEFTGLDYQFYRDKQIENAMKFADKGFVFNSSYYASVLGIKPQSFDRMLSEGHSGDLTDNLTLLLNGNIASGDSDKAGRPRKSQSDLKEGGQISQEYGNYQKAIN